MNIPAPKSLLCLWYFWNAINTGPWIPDPQGSVFIVSHNADNAGGAGLVSMVRSTGNTLYTMHADHQNLCLFQGLVPGH